MPSAVYNNYNDETDGSASDTDFSESEEETRIIKDVVLVCSSADRDWINRTDETPYNYTVRLGGSGLANNYLMVQNNFNNVISIGVDKLMINNRKLNVSYSNLAVDISEYPYLLVSSEDITENIHGTNKLLDKALGIMNIDETGSNYITLSNISGKAKEYYNTPISTLSKMKISITDPLGGSPNTIDDVLDIKSITYLDATTSNLSTEYLMVQTNDYFHSEQYKRGDILKFGDYVYRDTGTYAESDELNTFITRDNGHRLISIGTSDTSKHLSNRIYIPTPNIASVSTGNVDATTWFDDLKTKSMGNISTASSVTDTGKVLNYSLQTHVMFKMRIEERKNEILANLR